MALTEKPAASNPGPVGNPMSADGQQTPDRTRLLVAVAGLALLAILLLGGKQSP